ncbi:hypothetical protein LAB1_20610 [Roseibium sp. LAB1]
MSFSGFGNLYCTTMLFVVPLEEFRACQLGSGAVERHEMLWLRHPSGGDRNVRKILQTTKTPPGKRRTGQ